MKTPCITIVLVMSITVMMAVNTAAYLDPSVMTYLVQVIAGVVIVSGATFAVYWKKIRLFFKKTLKK